MAAAAQRHGFYDAAQVAFDQSNTRRFDGRVGFVVHRDRNIGFGVSGQLASYYQRAVASLFEVCHRLDSAPRCIQLPLAA